MTDRITSAGAESSEPPARRGGIASLRLAGLLAVMAIVGIPFVAILWETLNDLLAGHIRPGRLAVAVPLLIAFLGILLAAGRALARFESRSS